MKKINVGIVGGSGFTGGELCRLLLKHKNIENIYPTSRSDAFKTSTSGSGSTSTGASTYSPSGKGPYSTFF